MIYYINLERKKKIGLTWLIVVLKLFLPLTLLNYSIQCSLVLLDNINNTLINGNDVG